MLLEIKTDIKVQTAALTIFYYFYNSTKLEKTGE